MTITGGHLIDHWVGTWTTACVRRDDVVTGGQAPTAPTRGPDGATIWRRAVAVRIEHLAGPAGVEDNPHHFWWCG
jgi:hypothetical protein